ncbi:RNA polymerase sigma-54 factor [Bacillus sp. SG-1]|nr:RNA polymerase sigma-54 factor [Bacillus sp. SG-1]
MVVISAAGTRLRGAGVEPPRLRLYKSGSALFSPDRQMFHSEEKVIFPFIRCGLFEPRGWTLQLDWGSHLSSKVEAPLSAPTGKCSEEKKRRFFLLFSSGYLIPRGLALELDVPLIPQEV